MILTKKAVKAVIRDEQGRVLLLQRNPETRLTDNWDLPGGLLEEGESEEEALLREVEEELGVKAVIIRKAKTWHFPRLEDGRRVDVQNYDCMLLSHDIILSDEHKEYAWLTVAQIQKYPVKDDSLYTSIE